MYSINNNKWLLYQELFQKRHCVHHWQGSRHRARSDIKGRNCGTNSGLKEPKKSDVCPGTISQTNNHKWRQQQQHAPDTNKYSFKCEATLVMFKNP